MHLLEKDDDEEVEEARWAHNNWDCSMDDHCVFCREDHFEHQDNSDRCPICHPQYEYSIATAAIACGVGLWILLGIVVWLLR